MDALQFAEGWAEGCNSHDLDRILGHYRDDIVFRSNKALALTGRGQIEGIEALRAYWSAALARQSDLRFTVTAVYEGFEMIVIAYDNHRGVRATETLHFDGQGKVWQASACHAAT